jgi:hypothetical protein
MRARLVLLSFACAGAGASFACHSFDGFGPTVGDAGQDPVEDASADGTSDGDAKDGSAGDGPFATSADWSCLDAPPPPPSLPASLDVTLHVVDTFRNIVSAGATGGSDLTVVSATPLPGVSVRACPAFDPSCASSGTATVQSDDAGVAQLQLPSSFDGVLQLARPDLLTGTVYLGRFVDVAPGYPMPMIAAQPAEAFGAQLGVTIAEGPDAGLGHVFVSAYDCNDRFAPGVSFRYEPTSATTRTFYDDTKTILSTTDTATDTRGTGGAFNVPAGDVTVTATIPADGRTFRSAKVSVASGGATLLLLRARTVP